jgi:hypothetical protein
MIHWLSLGGDIELMKEFPNGNRNLARLFLAVYTCAV